jgi:hypothetical protein
MLDTDSEATAQIASAILNDPRVVHFYDPQKRVGKALAQSLGEADQAAWDIYLFYGPGVQWLDAPPTPTQWMHQLNPSSWADPLLFRTGQDLIEELGRSIRR